MASTTWPPKEGLSSPTVSRKDAIFSTSSSIRINAPASVVFDAVLEVGDYHKWNTFIPETKILVQPEGVDDFTLLRIGTIFNFYVVMNAAKPNSKTETGLLVTDMSTPDIPSTYISAEVLKNDPTYTEDLRKVYRVSWKQHGGFASKGLKTERFHEIIILGENECELRTWEVYGGFIARTVKWIYQSTLDEKFALWNSDLKTYTESKVSEGASA